MQIKIYSKKQLHNTKPIGIFGKVKEFQHYTDYIVGYKKISSGKNIYVFSLNLYFWNIRYYSLHC